MATTPTSGVPRLDPGTQFGISMLLSGMSSFDVAGAHKSNANQSLRNAKFIRMQGALAEDQTRKQGKKVLGFQRANLSASGVDIGSGSALDFLADQASTAEFNALNTRHMAELQALQAEAEARALKSQGRSARRLGAIKLGAAAFGFAG